MVKIIGNHTSLTPLSEEIVRQISKIENIKISPGLIVVKKIKIKTQKIGVKNEESSILLTILMKGSKQFLRLYTCNFEELCQILKKYCEQKNIIFQKTLTK